MCLLVRAGNLRLEVDKWTRVEAVDQRNTVRGLLGVSVGLGFGDSPACACVCQVSMQPSESGERLGEQTRLARFRQAESRHGTGKLGPKLVPSFLRCGGRKDRRSQISIGPYLQCCPTLHPCLIKKAIASFGSPLPVHGKTYS